VDSELIEQLRNGEFRSGESLGAALGISRAAVWKRIERLAEAGLDIERVRGKGYRVPGGVQMLDMAALNQGMAGALPVDVVLSTGSTNADALARLQGGMQAPFALLAEHQTAGRGRRGRAWASPFAGNLYLSLAWQFPVGASRLEGLSLAVGVVLAEALADAGLGSRVALKWPNDVWVEGAKIAGVLIELSGDLDDHCTAVIGIGVNGRLADAAATSIDQPWTDYYRETGITLDRNALVLTLLRRQVAMLEQYAEQGFAQWREQWQALDALFGKPVIVTTGGATVEGVAAGIDASGALRLQTAAGIVSFHGGEASLRPRPVDN
jgi:BirA family transcriptional regulator, biotin operon repressor / biotin---[acetyl-CoA-carboxylase] ligase